jgi:hypothetical protein
LSSQEIKHLAADVNVHFPADYTTLHSAGKSEKPDQEKSALSLDAKQVRKSFKTHG